ncbi:MAG TPA: FecR domain-containing protein, partial [Polyangia bacterium]|nr:FecR domain-containing protein [Polyangia bacterium]
MRSTSETSRGTRAVEALADLARDAVSAPTEAQIEEGLRGVLAARPRTRRRTVLRWSLAWTTVAAVAAAIVIVTGWSRRALFSGASDAPLAYRIDGGNVIEGGYLRETADAGGVKLTFAEGGTSIHLAPGTRGRLRSVDASGARLGIEHGSAAFDVVPHAGHKWLVDLGPFLVTVKGTRFTVSWNATTERFELCLRRGRVSVTGPMAGGEIPLEAGHRLVVDLPHGETRITELTDGEPDPEPVGRPAAAAAPAGMGRKSEAAPAALPARSAAVSAPARTVANAGA